MRDAPTADPTPDGEAERLAVLHGLAVLDSADEAGFVAVVRVAARVSGCPVALVSLVDAQRLWFKAVHGTTLRETDREHAFCAHAIAQTGVFEVPDAQADARFTGNMLVTGEPHARYYAGVPLRVDGAAIGTLCVIDTSPRQLDAATLATLDDLAQAVCELLKGRERLAGPGAERGRLLDFARASGDWMWETDAAWRYTWISGAFEPITGEPAQAWVGRDMPDVALLDALGEPRADGRTLHDVLNAGQPFSRVLCPKHTPRGRLVISRSAVPVRNAAGAVVGWRGTARDVTQRIATEREQRAQGQLLQQLSSQVPGVIYQFLGRPDGHGHFQFINDRVAELYGVGREPLMADASLLLRVIHRDDRARFRAKLAEAERQMNPVSLDYRVVHPDGSERWVVASSSPERLPDGSVVWRGFASDVTERKRIELALQASQSRWQMAAEATGIGVAQIDFTNGQLQLDERACAAHGLPFPHPTFSLDDWFATIVPEDRAAARTAMQHALDGGERGGRLAARYRFMLPGGAQRWLEIVARVEHDAASGQPVSLIGTCRDLTEQMAVEALRRDKEMAEHASREKSEFLSRVSHELRTPLNGILGFAQLMALDHVHALAPEQLHRLERVQRSGQHLLALVDDVLEIASIERSDFVQRRRTVDLARALESCRMVVEPLAAAHGVQLASSITGPCWVQGDERALEQVLLNLVSNAIKFNRTGGTVHLTLERGEEHVSLSIRDEGDGLTPDQQAQLFQPFNRLGAGRQRVEGTGLGLVIARELTLAMQGTLSVSSEAGLGCCFTLRLGAAAAGDVAEAAMPAVLEAPAGRADGQRQVLYIEDEPVNVVLMQEVFRNSGHWTLHTATNGAEGLAMARALRPDLLLVDINLPDMSGTALVRRLRDDPSTAGLRCIALSADAVQEQIAAARAAGFDDYWTKPIHVARMLSALSSVLAESQPA